MAAIIWTDVVALAPELSGVAAGAQTDILAYVNTAHSVVNWGGETSPRLRLARIYLAAHFASSGTLGNAGGSVTSKSEGEVSVSFGGYGGTSADALAATAYGRLYGQILRTSGARGPVHVF